MEVRLWSLTPGAIPRIIRSRIWPTPLPKSFQMWMYPSTKMLSQTGGPIE